MLEVADILRLHGQAFRQAHPGLLPFEHKILKDIEGCRTPYFGGHLEQCEGCGHQRYSYHSCGNRHCPKCHGQRTERWVAQQRELLLPCAYYLLTFTLPAELRALARTHPRIIYGLLMSTAAAALQKLAHDPQWVGGTLAMLAVLHTWTRALLYHPHVHLLVPAGGLSKEGRWVGTRHPRFLVPGFMLGPIFRAKFKSALRKRGWLAQVPARCWQKDWVVHCQHAGSGQKVLDYLARYVFRIAINNSRLEKLENGRVTFRYRDNRTQQIKHVTLPTQEFINRFRQHILPKGFVKVRTYGLWSAHGREQLEQARAQLSAAAQSPTSPEPSTATVATTQGLPTVLCPKCKSAKMIVIEHLRPQRNRPP